jgi:hypothetical protein
MNEEELSQKEIKAEFRFDYSYDFLAISIDTSSVIISDCVQKHDSIAAKIFIPPPEQV